MSEKQQITLKTRVYIDGYNLFYGLLKGTPYRWINPLFLVEQVLRGILIPGQYKPELTPVAVKYFTAAILERFARSSDSVTTQSDYWRALSAHLGTRLQIIRGRYEARPARAHLCVPGRPARLTDLVDIWKLEEKQTDVQLAAHALSDVLVDGVEHAVFVTNDTDFAPLFEMIKSTSSARIGLIVPSSGSERRAVNQELAVRADWVRSSISEQDLLAAQLPWSVRLPAGDYAIKPLSWYPRPDLLSPILAEAKRVKRNLSSAWRWLHEPSPYFDQQAPIALCNSETDVQKLHEYMSKYARDFKL
ncbi:MAG: NYN domain-containing protein [Ahniella sp.]|nr:NYN domain-containing protein [Ahniella sp.]